MEKVAIGLFGSPLNGCKRQLGGFLLYAILLAVVCIVPLSGFVRYVTSTELFSHVLLIPFISVYLVWTRRKTEPTRVMSSPLPALAAAAFGLLFCVLYLVESQPGRQLSLNDQYVLFSLGLLGFAVGGIFWFFGAGFVRENAFPVAFLVFMAPMPDFMVHAITVFFQHTSAEVSYWMIKLPGTSVFRQGLVFEMPGIAIEVAPECSGIRSSFVLFITSLLASYLFLKTTWKRAVLSLAVIPLGILRNGLRIFTISMLCVHVDPQMIDSFIHRKGGPVFFLISLIPLFLLLFYFRKSEKRKM